MKKFAIGLLTILLAIPYLFFATSVEEVDLSDRSFNCLVLNYGHYSSPVAFGAVFYDPINFGFGGNKRIVLPYFFTDGELMVADCGKESFTLGYKDNLSFIKHGDQIHLYTELQSIKFFGREIAIEEDISSFGTGWVGNKLGQTVLTKLIDGKEIKMFNRVPIKEKQ